jgi:hypothetical protein
MPITTLEPLREPLLRSEEEDDIGTAEPEEDIDLDEIDLDDIDEDNEDEDFAEDDDS